MKQNFASLALVGALSLISNQTQASEPVSAAVANSISSSNGLTLSCYVDTPAYDQYAEGYCDALIYNAKTAKAVFQVFGSEQAGRYTYAWTNCTSTSSQCVKTIYPFRFYNISVVVTDTYTGTKTTLTATANFEDGR
ncbi:MAG: hypothetical protein HYV16_03770 [Gammaproteobacteria bacterium]|nr:hypothetical protein [Gammaproteobacteria bacterium]